MANVGPSAAVGEGEGALVEHLARRHWEATFSAGMARLKIREVDFLLQDLAESFSYWRQQEVDALLRVTMAASVSIGAGDEAVNFFLEVAAQNLLRVGAVRERLGNIFLSLEEAGQKKEQLIFERSEARRELHNLANRIFNIRHPLQDEPIRL